MNKRGIDAVVRAAGAAVLVVVAAGLVGCAADQGEGATRANNANNQNQNPAGIGPSGATGASPRDMPGRGRGSEGPHGK